MVNFAPTNYVANLYLTDENTHYHQMIKFLHNSPVFEALTVEPKMIIALLTTFWEEAIALNDEAIHVQIAGKTIIINEETI